MNRALNEWRRVASVVGVVVGLLAGVGCRKMEPVVVEKPAVVAPELLENGLKGLPGAVYESQAGSKIRWQRWEEETFQRAEAARRLVFVVIAMPQYPAYFEVLGDLERDENLVKVINEEYVPVLVDGDAAREVGLVTVDLANEIRRAVQLPMFVWLTPDGNPVAWIPVPSFGPGEVRNLFDKSHVLVSRTWEGSPQYVSSNSELDNANRRERIARRRNAEVASREPGVDVIRALRQLASLYDPVSRSFDETGGLFPTGAIDALAGAVLSPAVHDELRSRSLRTLNELMEDVLPSAMFDPLDGGLFSSRRGVSWALPVFERDGARQAQAVAALGRVYQATGNGRVLERARGVMAFVEGWNRTADGLFALGVVPPGATRDWLWTQEEIQEALGEDAGWWIGATGVKPLGNLPSEADPRRDYFRTNSLGMGKSKAEIAAELGETAEVFEKRFERARQRLLEVRTRRMKQLAKDRTPHAVTNFRMVSAYAAMYCATGEEPFRERAVSLLRQAREVFADGADLWMYPAKTAPSVSGGRAFLYALAMQAALDVADLTEDEVWLRWAEDLATTAAERFAADDVLHECSDQARLFDLPITDLTMLFDESTAGLVSAAEVRLAGRERPLLKSFSGLATPLPLYSVDRPILHTDLLVASLVRHHGATVLMGTGLAKEMRDGLARLPLRMVKRRAAVAADRVPDGEVRVLWPDGEAVAVADPADLLKVLLPMGPNR